MECPASWKLDPPSGNPVSARQERYRLVLPCPSRSGVGRKWAVSTLSWIIGAMFGPNTSLIVGWPMPEPR